MTGEPVTGQSMKASPRLWRSLRDGCEAAQLVEFAVSLPLLVVFVVGIFDFSSAFTLKQKLTNTARDAARAAASETITDLSATPPLSVSDAFWIVEWYFSSSKLDDCGIAASPTRSGTTWTYSAKGGKCVGNGLVITINRGYYFPASAASAPPDVTCTPQSVSGTTAILATCVSIQYGYGWRFERAANLLRSTPVLPANISAVAVAMNEN
jgi:Flp pilus assembly protein TadG